MFFPNLVALRRKLASIKGVIFLFICVCMLIPFESYLHGEKDLSTPDRAKDRRRLMNKWHTSAVDSFYGLREVFSYSKLGGILFNRDEIPNPNPNADRTFVILVWKYWNWLKSRHVYNFGKAGNKENNLLEGCSVNNCVFSGNESFIDSADAVLVHLQKGVVPQVKNRNRTQRWIFLNDESPRNAFSLAKQKPSLASLYDVFNWSMTYRSDADVPVPYGRVLPLKKPITLEYDSMQDIAAMVPNWERKKTGRTAAVIMSNCGVKARNDFLANLKKYIQVDVYGSCSDREELKNSCPGHFRKDCDPVAEYIFYLVLENTSCFHYLTEKVFYHAYSKGAIPVIFGPALEDVETLLPPNSYMYADADTDVASLANDINATAKSVDLILSMHMWRNHFRVVNEHGYFGTESYHLCRVCEALNYNDAKEKVYNKELLDSFLDPKKTCYDENI